MASPDEGGRREKGGGGGPGGRRRKEDRRESVLRTCRRANDTTGSRCARGTGLLGGTLTGAVSVLRYQRVPFVWLQNTDR